MSTASSKPQTPVRAGISASRKTRRRALAVILIGLAVSSANTFGLVDYVKESTGTAVDNVRDSVGHMATTPRVIHLSRSGPE